VFCLFYLGEEPNVNALVCLRHTTSKNVSLSKRTNRKVEGWNTEIDRHHAPIDGKYLVGCISTAEAGKWSIGAEDEYENANEMYNVLFESNLFEHKFIQSSGDFESPLRHSSRVKKQSFSKAFFSNSVVARTFIGQEYQLGQVSSVIV
jgi:hypothetical protein